MVASYHPRPNDVGKPVKIAAPHRNNAPSTWSDPCAIACCVPDGPMPNMLNGIPVASWVAAPNTVAAWEQLAVSEFDEPAFEPPVGLRHAAGVVIVEPDGRIWLVCPTNQFGGYAATFPKGTVDLGASLRACAVREAFEESGLQVRLTGFLVDVKRTTSFARYYLATRIGGSPADAGWESQACMLVPVIVLADLASHASDVLTIAVLREYSKRVFDGAGSGADSNDIVDCLRRRQLAMSGIQTQSFTGDL